VFQVGVKWIEGDHHCPFIRAAKGVVPYEVDTEFFGNRVFIRFGAMHEDIGNFVLDFSVELEFESQEKAEMVADQIRKGLVV